MSITVNGITFEDQTGTSGDDVLNGTNGRDWLEGQDGNDTLNGGDDGDWLDGGAGADTMTGGAGDDEYAVNDAGDVVIENAGEGYDTIYTNFASVDLADYANFEGLTGGAADQMLIGNAVSNVIDGGLGADTMVGGLGNDGYFVDNVNDVVVEAAGEGADWIYTTLPTLSLELFSNVETLRGDSLDQTLIGSSGNNTLIGWGGSGTLLGGAGSDTYFIDSAQYAVVEATGEGTDQIVTRVDYALGAGVAIELLRADGAVDTSAINLTGNELDQGLWGNSAANTLNGGGGTDSLYGFGGNDTLVGGSGADRLIGGAGDDSYSVDNAGDLVFETASAGADTVQSSVTYALTANVENLTLSGAAAINGFGNGLDNVLSGNAAANVLNGGAGADTMNGGAGDDAYHVDNAADVVTEAASNGTDTVVSSVSFTLSANVEDLILGGSGGTDGIGNGTANRMTGNGSDNDLYGLDGNDRLNGGGGADNLHGGLGIDVLHGGAGTDQFVFDSAPSRSSNFDVIVDFNVADDTIVLDQTVFAMLDVGGLSSEAFVAGTSAQDGDDRIVYDSASGHIYYDADGSGGSAQVLFATVTGGTALTSSDFSIIG